MALRGQLQERLWPLLSGQCRQERSSDKRTTQKHLDLSCPVLKSNNNISKKRSYSWAFCVFTFTEHWQLITFHFLTGLVAADCSGPSPSFHTPYLLVWLVYRDSVTGLSGQCDWSIGTVWLSIGTVWLVYRDSVTVYRDSVTGLSGQRDWSIGTAWLVYRGSVAGLPGHSVTGLSGTLHTRGHLLKRFENCIHVACVFGVSVQTSRTRGLFMSHCIFF